MSAFSSSSTGSSGQNASAFPFPKHYHFRPFFTLQPVKETREKQLKLWRELVLAYHEHHRLYSMNPAACDELFRNPEVDRQLSPDAIDAVVASLLQTREAEWEDPDTRITLLIYWRPPEALARDIFTWASSKLTRFDAVVALAELNADSTSAPFRGVHLALLLKALALLEIEGKCAVIDGVGVKFAL